MAHLPSDAKLALADVTLTLPGAAAPLLRGLSLRLQPAEVVALVGRSGVGKSCLIRLCMGLAPTDSRVTGSARLDGTELLGLNSAELQPLRGRRMGWMTQGVATALEPTERIASQMTAVLRHLRGWETEQSLAALQARLLAFGVNGARELLSRRWGELSRWATAAGAGKPVAFRGAGPAFCRRALGWPGCRP